MKIIQYVSITLIALAALSGCNTTRNNSTLIEAHRNYNNAHADPAVTNLAALELSDASSSLSKADAALNSGENADTVSHLAYMANKKVAIAQETAKQKTAELAVTNAGENRNQARLEARTAEADAAKQQVAVMQKTTDQQAEQLAAANDNAQIDQAIIAMQGVQLNELKELNAKKTARGMVITLGDVLFSSNKSQLKPGGMRNVQKLADFLEEYPQYKVLIEGYTDSTGSDSLNQKLSERRANTVRNALVEVDGISADRVTARGYGKAYPVASNDTAASRQLNRRVEIIISDEKGNFISR